MRVYQRFVRRSDISLFKHRADRFVGWRSHPRFINDLILQSCSCCLFVFSSSVSVSRLVPVFLSLSLALSLSLLFSLFSLFPLSLARSLTNSLSDLAIYLLDIYLYISRPALSISYLFSCRAILHTDRDRSGHIHRYVGGTDYLSIDLCGTRM